MTHPRLSATLLVPAVLLVLSQSCSGSDEKTEVSEGGTKGEMATLKLTSPAFQDGETIPVRHTCEGSDRSPPLEWSKPPSGAKSLALICEDPDAPRGMWVHWVVWNLPPDSTSLPEAVPGDSTLGGRALHGKNDWGKLGYGGPCPPPGRAHRYFFKLYALDTPIALEVGANRKELLEAMTGHIVAEGQLMGKYAR